MKVQEYLTPNGDSPYQKWFNSLDTMAAAKVAVAIMRIEQGNTSNIKWFDGIGEYKINWGPGYRIYLAREGQKLIILFGGGTKKANGLILPRQNGFIKSTKAESGVDKSHEKNHTRRQTNHSRTCSG